MDQHLFEILLENFQRLLRLQLQVIQHSAEPFPYLELNFLIQIGALFRELEEFLVSSLVELFHRENQEFVREISGFIPDLHL